MTTAGGLWFVLGVCTLFYSVTTENRYQRNCNRKIHGETSGYPVHLGTAYLTDPYAYTYQVEIPAVCNGRTVGVKFTACDHYEKPDIFFISNYEAYVTRNGMLTYEATVSTVVYCLDYAPLGTGEQTPKLRVKPMPESRQLQRDRDTAKIQSLTDENREAFEDDSRRNTLNQARHQAFINSGIQRPYLDARLIHNKRFPRATQSSETEKTADVVRNTKGDKSRQTTVDQVLQQAAHDARHAETASDALSSGQLSAVQKRARRALRSPNSHQLTELLNPQTSEGDRQNAVTNSRYALDQAQKYAVQEAYRVVKADETSNVRQAADEALNLVNSNNVRQYNPRQSMYQVKKGSHSVQSVNNQASETRDVFANNRQGQSPGRTNMEQNQIMNKIQLYRDVKLTPLEEAYKNIAQENRYTDQTETQRNNLRLTVHKRLRRSSLLSDSRRTVEAQQEAQTSDASRNYLNRAQAQSSDALDISKRLRDVADSTRQSISTHLMADSTSANNLPASLGQARLQDNRRQVASSRLLSNDALLGTAKFQRGVTSPTLKANLDEAQKQAIQEAARAVRITQAKPLQISDNIHQGLTAIGRKATLEEDQQKSMQETKSLVEDINESAARRYDDKFRQAIVDSNSRQNDLVNQALQRSISDLNRATQSIQNLNPRQTEDKVRQYVIDNIARHNEAYDAQQTNSATQDTLASVTRQAADIRQAVSYQHAIEQAQQEAIEDFRRVVQATQEADARQSEENLRDAFTAYYARQNSLDQAQQQAILKSCPNCSNRVGHSYPMSDALEEAYRQTAYHGRQNDLDQAQQQAILKGNRFVQVAPTLDAREETYRQTGYYGRQNDLDQAQQQAIIKGNRVVQNSLEEAYRQAINDNIVRQSVLNQPLSNYDRQNDLGQSQQRAILKGYRGIQSAPTLDAREEAYRQAINENIARQTGQPLLYNARQYDLDQAQQPSIITGNRVIQTSPTLDALEETYRQSINNNIALQTGLSEPLLNNARQNDLNQAQQQAYIQSNRASAPTLDAREEAYRQAINDNIVRQTGPSQSHLYNARQNDLNQAQQQAYLQSNRAIQSAPTLDAREEAYRRAINNNYVRQTGRPLLYYSRQNDASNVNALIDNIARQSQQYGIQDSENVVQAAQDLITRKAAEQVRQAITTGNAHQIDVAQVQQKAIEDFNRAVLAAQGLDARRSEENLRQTVSAYYARQNDLDQAQQRGSTVANQAVKTAPVLQGREEAYRQAINDNIARQIGDSQSRLYQYRSNGPLSVQSIQAVTADDAYQTQNSKNAVQAAIDRAQYKAVINAAYTYV